MDNINEIFKPLLTALSIGPDAQLHETIKEATRLYECMPMEWKEQKEVIIWRRFVDSRNIYDSRIELKGKYKNGDKREGGLLNYEAICLDIITSD